MLSAVSEQCISLVRVYSLPLQKKKEKKKQANNMKSVANGKAFKFQFF